MKTTPKRIEEEFDTADRTEINRIISNLRQTYLERHTEAQHQVHLAQRQVNRAEHEMHRIERHLERIDEFCKKNNVNLDGFED